MSDEIINGDTIRYTTKELLREIRDKLHDINGNLAKHEMRIQLLERTVNEHELERQRTVPMFYELRQKLEIQEKVGQELKAFAREQQDRNDRGFTRWEKTIGLSVLVGSFLINAITLGPDLY